MSDVLSILGHHEIQGPGSCVAWAVELIVKLQTPLDVGKYPIQTTYPAGLGFGPETIKILNGYQIHAWDESLEWDDFERASKEDASKGLPLVFMLPQCVYLDFVPVQFGPIGTHACIALHCAQGDYAMRKHKNPDVMRAPIREVYELLRRTIMTDYKIHCLRYTKA